MRRLLRSAACAAALFAACGLVLAQDTTDFFPLKAKSTWVYKVGENTITQECTTGDGKDIKVDTKVSDKVVASEPFEVTKDGVYRTTGTGAPTRRTGHT